MAAVRVDRRMNEAAGSVALGRLRWITRALLAAALLAAGSAAVLWAAQRPRFEFHRIELVGELRHVSRAAVRTAIAGRLSGTFFTMRLAQARAAFESIPWVASVAVRRVWPDRLVVQVVERRALGVWNDGRVLAADGQLFEGNPAEAELDGARLEFTGPPRFAADAAAKVAGFERALAPMRATLAAVEISDRASWTLHTAGGQTLDLGRDEPPGSAQARLEAVAAGYARVLAQLDGAPARIDARYDNGFAASRP